MSKFEEKGLGALKLWKIEFQDKVAKLNMEKQIGNRTL